MRRPIVGVNVAYHPGQHLACLSMHYVDAIAKAGGVPVLLPPLDEPEAIDEPLGFLDACVLTGGGDLDCRNDGYYLHPSMNTIHPRRERFDRELVRKIANRKLPVFGIGCGMQLLNVAHGGTLLLDIAEDKPKALPHAMPDDEHSHVIEIADDSLMYKAYFTTSSTRIRVNSKHHQAVDDVADGFRVTARCPDGIVEAIESTTDWYAVGTQFHPEHPTGSQLDRMVFEYFLAGIPKKK